MHGSILINLLHPCEHHNDQNNGNIFVHSITSQNEIMTIEKLDLTGYNETLVSKYPHECHLIVLSQS